VVALPAGWTTVPVADGAAGVDSGPDRMRKLGVVVNFQRDDPPVNNAPTHQVVLLERLERAEGVPTATGYVDLAVIGARRSRGVAFVARPLSQR